MSAEGLRSALDALDQHWRERDPDWAHGLRPGLSRADIEKAEKHLRPMLLTEEHRVLYAWHDGDGDGHAFGDHQPWFIPLSEAIHQWRFGKDELGWTPCWLPLLNLGQDYRVSLIDSVPEDSSGVLDFYLQSEPSPQFPSIEAMVRWHVDCLLQGLKREAAEGLRQEYAGPILVRGKAISDRISAVFARDWPRAWKLAAGIDEANDVAIAATTTVAQLLAGKSSYGVIEGRVTWLGGDVTASIVQIDDGTGRVLVACPKGTIGVRELGMDFVIDVTLKPRTGEIGADLAFLEDVMGRPGFVAESVRFVRSLREEDRA